MAKNIAGAGESSNPLTPEDLKRLLDLENCAVRFGDTGDSRWKGNSN